MLVAPPPPTRGVLREAEIVDEVESARARGQKCLELLGHGRELPIAHVKARFESGANQRLYLRAVVVGGYEHLVAGLEP